MTQSGHRKRWMIALWCVAAACFVLSAPCVLLGGLGFLGIVADVGPAESREIGWGFLRWAMVPLALGVIALLAALLLRRSTK